MQPAPPPVFFLHWLPVRLFHSRTYSFCTTTHTTFPSTSLPPNRQWIAGLAGAEGTTRAVLCRGSQQTSIPILPQALAQISSAAHKRLPRGTLRGFMILMKVLAYAYTAAACQQGGGLLRTLPILLVLFSMGCAGVITSVYTTLTNAWRSTWARVRLLPTGLRMLRQYYFGPAIQLRACTIPSSSLTAQKSKTFAEL